MNSRLLKKYEVTPRSRLQELRAFAWQYNDWIDALDAISEIPAIENDGMPHGTAPGDPVARMAEAREVYKDKIAMVDYCIEACSKDQTLQAAVRKAVTTPRGLSFNWLKLHGYVLYERDAYYIALRKFYFTLDEMRG